MGNEMCLPLEHAFGTSFTQINLSGVSLAMRTHTHVLYPPPVSNQNFSRLPNTKLHESPFSVRDLAWRPKTGTVHYDADVLKYGRSSLFQ